MTNSFTILYYKDLQVFERETAPIKPSSKYLQERAEHLGSICFVVADAKVVKDQESVEVWNYRWEKWDMTRIRFE